MQQTTKYKLNLIETSDTFSPDPLNKNTQAVETELARVEAALAAKAENAALSAETAARDAALSALAGRVGALEEGRLVWKCSTYTGNKTSGEDHPTRLEFDFKPLLLIVGQVSSFGFGGFPWVRGMVQGRTLISVNYFANVILTWEDRAVQWVNAVSTDGPEFQLNLNTAYWYLALGVAE